jgi:hypothetical protein
MTKRMVLLAGIALVLSQLAVAGTVTYTTTGTFSSSSSATSALMPVTFLSTTQTITTPDAAAVLGSFSLGTFAKCTKTKPFCTTTDDFSLKITQSGGQFGKLTATVSGDVIFNTKSGALSWVFNAPATVTINGVSYLGLPGNSVAGLTVFGLVTGNVPEPNARLLLGLGTFGLMGLTLVSRKMLTN